jgi:leucyl/phenylalanyl-tRNA--protein transferase
MNDSLMAAYVELHDRGHAHSIEAWLNDELVGGLYGVHLGGAFFGESMFSRPECGGTDASKVCLVRLVAHLIARGFLVLDVQFLSPHLAQFGALQVPRDQFLAALASAVKRPISWETSCE